MASTLGALLSLGILMSAMTYPSSLVLVEQRRGRWAGWAMLGLFAFICIALGGPGFAAWMLAVFVVSGFGLSLGFSKSPRPEKIFLAGFGVALAAIVLVTAVTVVGGGLSADALHSAARALEQNRDELFRQYGLFSEEEIQRIQGRAQGVFSVALLLLPSLTVALAGITIWLNMLIVIRFSREGSLYKGTRDFSGWRAPEPLVFGVLVPATTLALSSDSRVIALAGNLLVVCMVPFFFHGMAITSHLLKKMALGPGMRFAVYALILGMFGVMIVPAQAALGVLDIWLDFRKQKKPPAPKTEKPDEEKQGD